MRVTQSMLSNNMLRNLTHSSSQMNKYMEQLSGKKISRPSDDPMIAMKGVSYRSELARIEQFERNTSEANSWLDNTDAAIDQANHAMQRLKVLATKASNETNSSDEYKSIVEEAKQLREHLVEIANTNVNGKYIFNGTNTGTKPIESFNDTGEIEPGFTDEDVQIEISSGITVKVNTNGTTVFGEGGELFKTVDKFIKRLENDENIEGSIEDSIGELDTSIGGILDSRAEIGARMNRLELVENRLADQKIVTTKTLSDNEDADFAEVITNLITQESLHRAALSAGSRIIQPSLVDFLR